MVKTKPVTWKALGDPGVHHLVDTYVWREGAQPPPKPICGARAHAVVYRTDGIYCRYCVVHEGLL